MTPADTPVHKCGICYKQVDNLSDIQTRVPVNAPKNFANVRCINHLSPDQKNNCLFRYDSNYSDYRPNIIYTQQAIVATILFEPGQEQALSYSFGAF